MEQFQVLLQVRLELCKALCLGLLSSPSLLTLYSLLQRLDQLVPATSFAFGDDIKFVAEVNEQGFGLSQCAVNVIGDWSITYLLPLSVNKSLIFHCAPYSPKRQHVICIQPLPTAMRLKNLGVLRSQTRPFAEHPTSLSANCRCLSGTICHAF